MVPNVPQVSLARQKYVDECEAAINEQIKLVSFYLSFSSNYFVMIRFVGLFLIYFENKPHLIIRIVKIALVVIFGAYNSHRYFFFVDF